MAGSLKAPGRSDAANKGWLTPPGPGRVRVNGDTDLLGIAKMHAYTCVHARVCMYAPGVGEFGSTSLDRSDRYAAGLISKVKGEAEARA